MRWRGRRQSDNIEDTRRSAVGPAAAGGGGIAVIIIALIGWALFGQDPRQALQQVAQQQQQQAAAVGAEEEELSAEDQQLGEFVSVILADSEDVWNKLYPQMTGGQPYREPTLKLFRAQTMSGCGPASSASGPFYCPADQKVYLDTAFFHQLANQLNAPGDFAQAYVIAHEVGHHVQNLLGTTDMVDRVRRTKSEVEYNKYSVRLELQADFLAGVMFHHAQRSKNILESGDIEEGLRAAAAIGDDTLQERAGRRAQQETFTHGSSEQRVRWFMKGLQTGDPAQGNTFEAASL